MIAKMPDIQQRFSVGPGRRFAPLPRATRARHGHDYCNSQPTGFAGSHNEWDVLQEVVVGSAFGARRPKLTRDQLLIEYPGVTNLAALEIGQFSDRIIEETEEDLNDFVCALQKLGIKVRRPQEIDHSNNFGTGDWSTNGFYRYCPRDSLLVVGDCIIETPMTMRSRLFEQFCFKEMLIDYLREGARWFSAPKPRLLDELYSDKPGELVLGNLEPVFDAANVLRAGKDLFYLISNTGNELGAQWLQNMLGNTYRVNVCRNLYSGVHLDSTMALLRPGLVLLNPERVNERNLPERLKSWDKIWCPDLVDTGFEGPFAMSSVWVGMNIFMLGPNHAVVDVRQTALLRELEKNGIDVLALQLRHSRTLGGGFHCVTLDTKRQGVLADYF